MNACKWCGRRPVFSDIVPAPYCEYCLGRMKDMGLTVAQFEDMKARRMTFNHYKAEVLDNDETTKS